MSGNVYDERGGQRKLVGSIVREETVVDETGIWKRIVMEVGPNGREVFGRIPMPLVDPIIYGVIDEAEDENA